VTQGLTTGIRMGVMQPDPVPVVLEAVCPGCHQSVRGIAMGHIGQEVTVEMQHESCGTSFTIDLTTRALDS
jgi:hypothetical protein